MTDHFTETAKALRDMTPEERETYLQKIREREREQLAIEYYFLYREKL